MPPAKNKRIAINKGKITVFGGEQKRPNIHMNDMVDIYIKSLAYPKEKIAGKIFNVGYQNYTVLEIAHKIKDVIGKDALPIEVAESDDKRSYSISSEKIKNELGFVPHCTVEQAIEALQHAFERNVIPNALEDKRYYNIRTMQAINLQ